ncbi:MAG TPA: AraC family transcriptional regulator [Rhodanobacter sp.]
MKADNIPLSRSLFDRLAAQKLDAHAVLRRAGLPMQLVDATRAALSTAQFFALWQAIGDESDGDPGVGLRIGEATRSELCDVASLAALHAANLGDALDTLARYKRLTCPEDISIERHGGEVSMGFRWILAQGHTPPLLFDAIAASMVALAQRGTGMALVPLRLELTRRPQHTGVFGHHFGCEVRFNAAQDRLVFRDADLALPFLDHQLDRLAELLPPLEIALHEQNSAWSLSDRVRHVLRRGMRGQPLRMAQVADALHLSTRTLQRRLGEAGTSYQELLDQVRSNTARHLLDATDLDTGEIAFLLGFEELNSFTRAFRHWEGATPMRWRAAAG